jgi:hypothetical protein
LDERAHEVAAIPTGATVSGTGAGVVTGFLAGAVSLLRRHDRELVCRGCGAVVAFVAMRPLSLMKVTDPEGHPVNPDGAASAIREVSTLRGDREAAGASDAELLRIDSQINYLRKAAGEPIYQLTCRDCQTRHVVSAPALSHLTRTSRISRVQLK